MQGNPYVQQVMDTAGQYGVDPDLAYKWINQESGFKPTSRSSAGAYGLAQLMPQTASDLGVDINDPTANLHGGFKYLTQMRDKYGSMPLAFAAYNAGPGRVDDYLKNGTPLPSETTNYVKAITGAPLSGGPQPAMKQAMSQGNGNMPSQTPPPSLAARVIAGGPGALFGAPGGVFPDAQGNPGEGYDLGHSLQTAGAGLTSISNPAGGAAMMNAANMPLFRSRFSVTRDALGNMVVVNNHTGQIMGSPGFNNKTTEGGYAPNSPAAILARTKEAQESSQKKLDALTEASTNAATLRDKANEALKLLDDPNYTSGALGNVETAIAAHSGGLINPAGAVPTGDFNKIASQLQGLYLSGQKGVRFAGPEIKFSEMANADSDKPKEVNRQILNDYVRQAELQINAAKLANQHMKTHGMLGPQFNDDLHALYGPGASAQLNPSAANSTRPPLSSFNR